MTRKTQLLLVVAAALVSGAAVAALWLTHGNDPAQAQAAPAPEHPNPKDVPPDPQALSEVRKAYQDELAKDAPPGMTELMHGPDKGQTKPGDLPPLPVSDPLVVPAGHQSSGGPSADLPPLPPLDPAPPAKKRASEEAPPAGLPPLPPPK